MCVYAVVVVCVWDPYRIWFCSPVSSVPKSNVGLIRQNSVAIETKPKSCALSRINLHGSLVPVVGRAMGLHVELGLQVLGGLDGAQGRFVRPISWSTGPFDSESEGSCPSNVFALRGCDGDG